ncbi:lactonase family protein [Nostoc sp. CHAB 5844]|nr:lactonase family protein [Nostoc sp. CHAB 5844]
MGVYSYDEEGNLTFIKAVPNSGIFICWIAINRAGTRLYTTNPADNSVTVYDIAKDPKTPVEIQKVTLKGPMGGGGAQLTLDSKGEFLHVVSQPATNPPSGNNGISVLKVNPYNGTLTEVLSSPLIIPAVNNSFPQGIFAN